MDSYWLFCIDSRASRKIVSSDWSIGKDTNEPIRSAEDGRVEQNLGEIFDQ
jgi:hypothetical protein